MAVRHYVPRAYPFAFTNGVQGSWLEVDPASGFVKLIRHFVVEDCGTIINPQLVDEQIRGGVVQGIAGAPGAVMNAVNDALAPLGAAPITEMPITPGVVLAALGKV